MGAGFVHGLFSCTIIRFPLNWFICLVETITYITKSDADFYRICVLNRKNFFETVTLEHSSKRAGCAATSRGGRPHICTEQ